MDAYIRLLRDKSPTMRYYGALHLRMHPTRTAIRPLLDLLADESIETRHCAAHTLGSWKEGRPELRTRLESTNTTIAGVAACTLSRFPDETIELHPLHAYLQQELPKTKGPPYNGVDIIVHLIRLIEEQGNEASLPVLRVAQEHEHRTIREAASMAIDSIRKPQNQ